MNDALAVLLGNIAEPSQRQSTLHELAKKLGARDVIFFVRDPSLHIFLPAVGNPQTIPNMENMNSFLLQSIKHGIYAGKVNSSSSNRKISAVGVAYRDCCVLVAIGGRPSLQKLKSIMPILSLFNQLFIRELREIQVDAQETLSARSVYEAENMAKKLDAARRELQGALLKAQSEVAERLKAEKEKDEFIGIATHELKTPVTSLKAYAEVLHMMFRKKGDDVAAETMNKMNMQLNKLTNLIGDLLDTTRIDNNSFYLQSETFNFDDLVQEIAEEVQLTSSKHTILIKTKANAEVTADRDRLGQVLTNLLTNAVKYSPTNKEIHIYSSAESSQLTACVQDFGIGIPQNRIHSVFERFFRVSGPKQHTYPGLGLGLFISSEIIKRQGGRIWVESVEGGGSTFCISLPLSTRPTSIVKEGK